MNTTIPKAKFNISAARTCSRRQHAIVDGVSWPYLLLISVPGAVLSLDYSRHRVRTVEAIVRAYRCSGGPGQISARQRISFYATREHKVQRRWPRSHGGLLQNYIYLCYCSAYKSEATRGRESVTPTVAETTVKILWTLSTGHPSKSASSFVLFFLYGHQDTNWLCDAPSVF